MGPAKYDIKTDSKHFLSERVQTKKKKRKDTPPDKIYKAGPRDIGRINLAETDWKPAKYDIKTDNKNFLSERIPSKKKKKNVTETKVYKAGPRDIGRIDLAQTDWKPAQYDIKNDGKHFLSERVPTKKRRKRI